MDFRELLHQHPFLRILLPLVLGIFLAKNLHLIEVWVLIVLISLFIPLFLIVTIRKLRKSLVLKLVYGIIAFFFFIALGSYRTLVVNENMQLSITESNLAFKVKLSENPTEKKNTYSCEAKVIEQLNAEKITSESARVILYFRKDSLAQQLKAGNCLLINSKLERVKNSGNPYEFDYAGYLKTRHILYSSYLKPENWIKISNKNNVSLKELAWKWRDQLLQIYRENGIEKESFDILAALTLGYKTNIDPEVSKAWADAGAMHVLAVSGLHVGIIYLVMNFILGFLKRMKYGCWIRCILLIAVLGFYAVITGLSPSVLRATCMFGFIIIGEALKRKGGVFNSLAASAVFLLLVDPYLIFTVGFQFSYLAVAGIVFFQPRFTRLFYISNPIINKMWQLTTVAISAQITTFPLTIYYFNQFPSYFLFSGYVVILMAGILIYLSAALLILSPFEWIASFLGFSLQKSLELLNQIIVWIQKLPGAVIQNCSFSSYEVLLLYLLIFTLIFVVVLKRKYAVFSLLLLLIAFQLPHFFDLFKNQNKELIVFNAGNNSLLAIKNGQEIHYLHDKELTNSKFELLTKNYHLKNHIRKVQLDTLKDLDFWKIEDMSILTVCRNNKINKRILNEINPDIIFVRKSGIKMDDVLTKHSVNSLILIDGSVYRKDIEKIKSLKEIHHSNLHVINEKGAFIVDLSSRNEP